MRALIVFIAALLVLAPLVHADPGTQPSGSEQGGNGANQTGDPQTPQGNGTAAPGGGSPPSAPPTIGQQCVTTGPGNPADDKVGIVRGDYSGQVSLPTGATARPIRETYTAVHFNFNTGPGGCLSPIVQFIYDILGKVPLPLPPPPSSLP